MSAYTGPERRAPAYGWITRTLADTADIRTPMDALAFLLCGALIAVLVWMITHPGEFFDLVMGWLS